MDQLIKKNDKLIPRQMKGSCLKSFHFWQLISIYISCWWSFKHFVEGLRIWWCSIICYIYIIFCAFLKSFLAIIHLLFLALTLLSTNYLNREKIHRLAKMFESELFSWIIKFVKCLYFFWCNQVFGNLCFSYVS